MNHFFGEISMLGLVPIWFCNEFFGNGESEGIKHLKSVTDWKSETGNNTVDTERLLVSIARGMTAKCGVTADVRMAENATCKIFRSNKNEKSRFRDIIFAGAPLFINVRMGTEVIVPGEGTRTIDGPLINHWSYNGQMHTTTELHSMLQVRSGTCEFKSNILSGFSHEIVPRQFFCVSACLYPNIAM